MEALSVGLLVLEVLEAARLLIKPEPVAAVLSPEHCRRQRVGSVRAWEGRRCEGGREQLYSRVEYGLPICRSLNGF